MERLTSNKKVSEMTMYELAHNSCYAKDGYARIRSFDNDFDARELAIKLLERYANIPDNFFVCDEDFDDFISQALQHGTEKILGLIAVFYQNIWSMADLRERLKEYEDLDEQGKLLKLPCVVGDRVYRINKGKKEPVIPMICIGIAIRNKDELVIQAKDISDDNHNIYSKTSIGKTIFLTKEEAEAALEKL